MPNHNINGKLVDHIINYPTNNLHDKFSNASSRDRNAIKYWKKKSWLSFHRRWMSYQYCDDECCCGPQTNISFCVMTQNIFNSSRISRVVEGGKKVRLSHTYSNYAWCMERIYIPLCVPMQFRSALWLHCCLPSMMHSAFWTSSLASLYKKIVVVGVESKTGRGEREETNSIKSYLNMFVQLIDFY